MEHSPVSILSSQSHDTQPRQRRSYSRSKSARQPAATVTLPGRKPQPVLETITLQQIEPEETQSATTTNLKRKRVDRSEPPRGPPLGEACPTTPKGWSACSFQDEPIEEASPDAKDEAQWKHYSIDSLWSDLQYANEQVCELQKAVEAERANLLRVKQDMVLHLTLEMDKKKKIESELRMTKSHVVRITEYYKREIDVLHADRSLERQRTAIAVQQMKNWRTDAEHHLEVINTMQGDIEDLRRIENEEQTKREDNFRGLPPAYGSLNDDTNAPPYARHEDSGPFDLPTLKHYIAWQFDKRITHWSIHASKQVRQDEESASVYGNLAVEASTALAQSCRGMQTLLAHRDEVSVGHLKYADHRPTAHVVRKPRARKGGKVAASLAKLAVELIWRTLGVIEVRPAAAIPSSPKLALEYALIDDVLLALLQAAFVDKRSLDELAYYNTQLSVLERGFRQLFLEGITTWFGATRAWLSDQVIKEREMAANNDAETASECTASGGVGCRCGEESSPEQDLGGEELISILP